MKSFFQMLFIVGVSFSLLSCRSHPVVPEGKNVKVSRDEASKDCKDLGRVQGSLIGTKPDLEKAIENMKQDAANKGANYVRMETASSYGTSVSGTAYFCP